MFTVLSYILFQKPPLERIWYPLFECTPKKYFLILKDDKYSRKRYNSMKTSTYLLNEGEGCIILKYYNDYLLSYSDFGTLDSFWNNILTMIKYFLLKGEASASLPETATYITISKISEKKLLFHKKVKTIIQVSDRTQDTIKQITDLTSEVPTKEFLTALLEASIDFCYVGEKYFFEDYKWMHNKATELLAQVKKMT